jgi:adenosylmethionine-8-amino-7-oxononanoate aminotransferase
MGELLEQGLRTRFAEHPHVGDIRGRGLFWALELVQDRATKRPFDPGRRLHARIKQAALDAGLLCYPMGGTLDGVQGDHVLLAPPFIIEPPQIGEILDKLERALRAAL